MKRFDLGILVAAVAILAGGVGFAIGHATAGKAPTTASSSGGVGGNSGYGGGGGGARRGGFGTRGTVTAVSASSITITDQNGTTHAVNVSSDTMYTNGADRSAATAADVTTGSTILAAGQTASDGSIAATRIIINPPAPGSFGGGATGGPSAGSSVN